MAAQDYYQPSTHQYQPYTSQPSVPYPQSQYGQAPSYHHNEPLDHRPTPPPPPADLHPSSMYTDDIPLKNQNRVQTNQTEWPAAQHTAYPPSPESQHPDPALLPSSDKKRRRKQKKKGGFFSGKVPCNLRYPESPWPCPNTTSTATTDPNNKCTLGELCGMGGFDYNHPNQWYRFITPIFLHAGIIHIGFNMLLQLTLGRDMEKAIGTVRFMIVYLSSGIFGFVLGGNFAAPAIASTGASGCLFGILALVLLDIFYTWNERPSPGKDLLWLLFDIVISFALGLLPGLDNFSHIGGFLMGLVLGICILHSPSTLRKRIETRGHKPSYSQIGSETNIPTTLASGAIPPTDGKDTTTTTTTTTITRPASLTRFTKQPVSFFKNRKPAWWAWWLIRAGCLIGVLIGFIVLLTNFYKYRDQCSWCKYLSCLNITVGGQNWCELGNMTWQTTEGTGSGSARRKMVRRVVGGIVRSVFRA
ncbi:hypothetical protein LTS08_003661 [Lithohypha guttulata]|nr:hypothetical protein LTS08_003661 [Lithohypha guttulata]